ncbi:MAG: long-chain fatty acid--CoA ligase [Candidatus Rokubacteria bacterium RBG_16_73_20]|nr:MAG: long-chain fatty acid--CoA ligase [Candidatus Rokubacteria bacterium RBG_16_73_20]
MNVAHHLERGARFFPDKPALLFEGAQWSYRQLEAAVNRTARGLGALGVTAGERVALHLPNVPAFPIAYLAVQKLGAVAVSVNVMLTTGELDYVLGDSGAKAVFTTEVLWPALAPLVGERLPRAGAVVCEGEVAGLTTLEALGANHQPELRARDMDRDAPAAILYTSGTTGRQKGAVLSHGNIVSNLFTVNRYLRMTPSDRLLVTTPLFHVAAQNVGMNAGLNAGATLVLHRRFDAERCAAAIEEHRVTFLSGVPTMYIALLNAGVGPEALASVRLFQSAAATMPLEIARRWRETYGTTIYEGYGLTETSPAATFNHEYEYRPGSVGTAVDMVEMRVVDPDDRDVPPGTWGEVVFRGPNVMLGYWNRPAETAEAMRGGWLHTGDVGYLDADGYLFLVDRMKDMINSAGFKIWPREVEEVLYLHPAVQECAVAGVPDPVKGEIAKAYVVLGEGAPTTAEALDAYCRERLAAYKVPRAFAFVAELPKNPAGKVLKRLLREREAAAPRP